MDSNLILLAGGRSKRMNFPKGLLSYKDQPWLIQQLRFFKVIGLIRVVLVLGHNFHQYFDAIPELADCENKVQEFNGINLSLVINQNPEEGSFSSLKCGLATCNNENSLPAFVKPVDVPPANMEIWQNLYKELLKGRDIVVPSHQRRGGHPVILASDFIKRLIKVPVDQPDARLDHQITALNQDRLHYLNVNDPKVKQNINTPEEWNNFISVPD